MSAGGMLPAPSAIVREAIIVVGGAILAAAVIGAIPPVRDWIKRQWAGTPSPLNPWA